MSDFYVLHFDKVLKESVISIWWPFNQDWTALNLCKAAFNDVYLARKILYYVCDGINRVIFVPV